MVEAIVQVSEIESGVRSWPCLFCLWVVVMMVPLGLWGGWDLKAGRGWCGHNDGDRENNNRETWWWWFILALK
jgi:hypothetical protein